MKLSRGDKLAAWKLGSVNAEFKEPERKNASYWARNWIWLFEDGHPTRPAEGKAGVREHLLLCFEWAVWNALKTGNTDVFHHFADALATEGTAWHPGLTWFYAKHKPNQRGQNPKFTLEELQDAAQADNIQVSGRTIQRWMKNSPFNFKHSRRR